MLHSVLSCLLKCTNDWYLNIDKGKFTSVTFIDLKKAFDTVNHEILLKKLIFMDLSTAFDCAKHDLLIANLHAYGPVRYKRKGISLVSFIPFEQKTVL